MKRRYYLAIAVVAILAGGCTKAVMQTKADSRANPWTNLDFNNKADNFQFAIVADRTGGARKGVFADAIYKINLLQPEFVMCVGDSIEGQTEDEAEIEQQWTEFQAIVGKLDMPFFYVCGNHDIDNPVLLKNWHERFGRTYYHFLYHDVLFLCLESEGGATEHDQGSISKEQIKYFRDVLRRYKDVRWTLVFVHKPLWQQSEPSWLELEQLLGNRDYTVFAGHEHQYARAVRNGKSYIRLATTGAVSSLDGPIVGTFDHIVWATMTDYGPKIANLMLDGIYDENVTPYAMAAAAKMLKDKIDDGQVIRFDPIIVEGDMFTGGRTIMRLANFAAISMKASGTFVGKAGLTVRPENIELTVKPLSTKTVDVEITTDKPVPLEQLRGIDFAGEIEYNFGGLKPVRAKVPARIEIAVAAKQKDKSN